MSKRLHVWFIGGLLVMGIMTLTASLMQGLRLESVTVLMMLLTVWVTGVWLLRRVWMAMLLCVVCLPAGVGIPLPFLWKVEMFAWLMASIAGLAIWNAMVREGEERAHPFMKHKVMLTLIVVILIRVFADMPGSARMGSRGGLSIAISHIAGVLAFPMGLWIAWHAERSKRNVVTIAGLSILAYGVYLVVGSLIVRQRLDNEMVFLGFLSRGFLFEAPVWLLMSCVLGLTMWRAGASRVVDAALFTVFSVIGVGVALVSVHRAFPVYAIVISCLTAWGYRRTKYVVPVFAVVTVVVSVTVALYARGVYLPEYLRRPMSVFTGNVLEGRIGEYGWENKFRERRIDEFLASVSAHPWVGRGFSYSSIEMKREVETEGHFALLQSYHNSFFTMISACGIPIGLTFSALVFWMMAQSAIWVRRLEMCDSKGLGIVLLSFLVVSLVHASVQGGGLFLGRCMLALGILEGLRDRLEWESVEAAANRKPTPESEE